MKDMRAEFELVGMWEHDCVPVKNGGRSRMEPSPMKKDPRVDSPLLKSTNAASYSYPEEALKCSKLAFDYLHEIMQRWESKCNPGLDASETTPTQRAFFRPYHNSGGIVARKVFYVTSYKFFVDVEDASTVDVDSDLEVDFKMSKMSDLLEDEELMQQFHSGKKKQKQKSDINEAFTLNGLLDPGRRYETWKDAGHGLTKLNAPQVFDKDGVFIHPNEYEDKLKDGIPVIVEVEPRVWHIKKSNKKGNGASPDKQTSHVADDHSKLPRTYELKLKSMKLLTSESLGSITPVIVPTPKNSPSIWLKSPPSVASTSGGGGRSLKRERPGSPTPTGPRVKRAK
ncbi:hypothetical protein CPC08DRAFT_747518 [Agrocybe pediades]|nr:hypothetical protein CPC08DRAFT_747518 [Agrocybe pediades]